MMRLLYTLCRYLGLLCFCCRLNFTYAGFPYPIGAFLRYDSSPSLSALLSVARAKHNQAARQSHNHSFALNILYANIQVKSDNVYAIWQAVCDHLRFGVFGMLASSDHWSSDTFNSVASRMHMPYVNWRLPAKLLADDARLSPFAVSVYPPLHELIGDTIVHSRWTHVTFLQDYDDAGIEVAQINDHIEWLTGGQTEFTVELVQLPANELLFDDFIYQLHQHRYGSAEHRFIVQMTSRHRQRWLLSALSQLSLQSPDKFHYMFAHLGLSQDDKDQLKTLYMNFTYFEMVDYKSDLYKSYEDAFRQSHIASNAEHYHVDNGGYDYYAEEDMNAPHRRKELISTEAAFVHDALVVLTTALNEHDRRTDSSLAGLFHRGRFINDNHPGLYCVPSQDELHPNRPFRPFVYGRQLADIMRNLKIPASKTLTGRIEFNSRGLRTNFAAKVHHITYAQKTSWSTEQIQDWDTRTHFGQRDPQTVVTVMNQTEIVHIVTVASKPFAFEEIAPKTGRVRLAGYVIDLVELLSKVIGFEYRVHLVRDGQYGSVDEQGHWNGMIGELISKVQEADMAVAPLTINRIRERVVDFSKPFITTGITIMIKKPDSQDFSVFAFMEPFSSWLWLYISFAFLGISTTIFLISRFSPYDWQVIDSGGYYTIRNDFNFYNTLFFTFAAFMNQGTEFSPRSVSNRMATSAWWFFSLIIIASYTANLAAFLTSEKLTAPVDSVEALAKQTNIKYGIQGGGSTAQFFETSTVDMYKKMWKFMTAQQRSVFTKSYDEGIARVRESKGKYAFLLEGTANEYHNTRRPCDTMKVGDLLNSVGYGIATPFGSKWRHPINIAVLTLQEQGELKKLVNKWCVSLNLSKVAGVFYVLLFSMLLSISTAILEYCFRVFKSHRAGQARDAAAEADVKLMPNATVESQLCDETLAEEEAPPYDTDEPYCTDV